MKIVMPMAGSGKRFAEEGYSVIKPLIKLGEKTIVAHACDSFPGSVQFIFICSKEHLAGTGLRAELERIRPDSEIIAIEPHNLGPVHSTMQAAGCISDDEEVIINYCDFTMDWRYDAFLTAMHEKKADGGIPAFRGFQPAQFTGTRYAYLKVDAGMRVLALKEKEPFTDDRVNEYASTGTYYFRTGRLMKQYSKKIMEMKIEKNKEYYSSLPYLPMINDRLRIFAFEVQKFICFGTPADARHYAYWHEYFSKKFRADGK